MKWKIKMTHNRHSPIVQCGVPLLHSANIHLDDSYSNIIDLFLFEHSINKLTNKLTPQKGTVFGCDVVATSSLIIE